MWSTFASSPRALRRWFPTFAVQPGSRRRLSRPGVGRGASGAVAMMAMATAPWRPEGVLAMCPMITLYHPMAVSWRVAADTVGRGSRTGLPVERTRGLVVSHPAARRPVPFGSPLRQRQQRHDPQQLASRFRDWRPVKAHKIRPTRAGLASLRRSDVWCSVELGVRSRALVWP